ncbi:unnamed protein product [Trypanosoma congolense IL3000]|uniref:WGS project CAEQ00000000 data, annotated contig 160 n=1 Tax=Trypanosoma congolense (strain IL3000) TaxID=1068625 RepID=F9W7F4_TRYCI|nr:unnamed protein product [Trypanosoma congolense IL3000]
MIMRKAEMRNQRVTRRGLLDARSGAPEVTIILMVRTDTVIDSGRTDLKGASGVGVETEIEIETRKENEKKGVVGKKTGIGIGIGIAIDRCRVAVPMDTKDTTYSRKVATGGVAKVAIRTALQLTSMMIEKKMHVSDDSVTKRDAGGNMLWSRAFVISIHD